MNAVRREELAEWLAEHAFVPNHDHPEFARDAANDLAERLLAEFMIFR